MSKIERGHVCENPGDFVELVRWWLESTDESTVGEVDTSGRVPWVFVETGSVRCHLNGDTSRAGVSEFLALADAHGADMEWRAIANRKGKVNKVGFGPAAETVKGFYLYTGTELPAGTSL